MAVIFLLFKEPNTKNQIPKRLSLAIDKQKKMI
jgi:hypothetical protein